MSEALIRLEGISKSFGRVRANSNVSLEIVGGRVLALLGENGAGKSTLMSILAGQLRPDSGTVSARGRVLQLTSPEEAIAAGIGMVYQHFKLVEAMTVAENVFLGHRQMLINRRRIEAEVKALASQFGMSVKPSAVIRDLSMGERQQVEILKLLYRRSEVLIFDEPTAVLTPAEAENLFATMRLMLAQGKGIVFISHKLEEVMSVADDIAILRRGEIVDTVPVIEVSSTAELAERMVGRKVLLEVEKKPVEIRQQVLSLHGLGCGERGDGVSFELRQGEILGIVGVAGNGQKELVETVCGLCKPHSGTVRIFGREWGEFFRTAADDPDNTLAWIAEDRQGLATCPSLDLLDNFLLTTRRSFSGGPGKLFLFREEARKRAEYLLKTFDVRPPDLSAAAWQLSGGNLQKMVLAREFYRKPRLIVAEQPTQGLDISAMEEVWKLLLKAREAAGILLVTGDLAEALTLSDRIGVMFDGRLLACFPVEDTVSLAAVPQMMAGICKKSATV
ncbi:MAG: ABC transporter ATP-binding protein [Desulforhopalus sp.]|nr:ABC transporter ATP-binding protein [Desulforhopalus sp.]